MIRDNSFDSSRYEMLYYKINLYLNRDINKLLTSQRPNNCRACNRGIIQTTNVICWKFVHEVSHRYMDRRTSEKCPYFIQRSPHSYSVLCHMTLGNIKSNY